MSETCEECPKNVNCSDGDQLFVEKGFWRKSINSTVIYSCPKYSACLGGFDIKNEFPV